MSWKLPLSAQRLRWSQNAVSLNRIALHKLLLWNTKTHTRAAGADITFCVFTIHSPLRMCPELWWAAVKSLYNMMTYLAALGLDGFLILYAFFSSPDWRFSFIRVTFVKGLKSVSSESFNVFGGFFYFISRCQNKFGCLETDSFDYFLVLILVALKCAPFHQWDTVNRHGIIATVLHHYSVTQSLYDLVITILVTVNL